LQGELTGLVGITHDVTELKAQEQALRQSEQRMRMILHGTRAGTWDWYVQTGKTIFNERWADIVGYTLEELAPISIQTWVDLTHPDDLESSNQLLEKHFSGETAYYDCQARMKHKEGHWVWVWDRGMVVEWTADGKPLRMLGTQVDITKQRDTELALRESEEKFRMFIESAPIATIISNLDGEIVLVNRATEKLFDYQRDELIGQSIQILVPNDWRDNHKLLMTDYTIAEHLRRSDAMELTARHRDGHIFPADIQLSHVQIDPDPLIMVFVIDITRRKQSEDVLKRSLEREQELSELKSQFVSTASHQFRTPLAAILSTTETLTAYRERMTDKQIGERLDRIRNQVNRMKRLMDDVLELSRIQAKQIQYIPVQSDLDALCREVIDEFAHQEGYQNRIVYEGPGAALISKHDPHLMHHVISNLVHNALKYSEKAVFVYLAQVDDELVFTVKDQGIGIPMDDIKNLFIPFSRARNVGTIEGTGLGLSITK
ncbi:MAG: PAS domain S-box protein, partial [Anaerolineales bacterium]|nr:PAS domain S-box protein [Anaerolineales bacterium]